MRQQEGTFELQLKNSFSASKPNTFARGRKRKKGKKKHPSQIDENQSKYGLVVADRALLAVSQIQAVSSGMALNTDWTRFLCQLLESCTPVPHISWVYYWKLSDLFCSLPVSWKMILKKKAERLSSASTGCLLNKCPQSSWTHHGETQALGKVSFIITPWKSWLKSTRPYAMNNLHLSLFTNKHLEHIVCSQGANIHSWFLFKTIFTDTETRERISLFISGHLNSA